MAWQLISDQTNNIVLFGDSCSGKTSIALRLHEGDYKSKTYKRTIGLNTLDAKVLLYNGKYANAEIWDVGSHVIGDRDALESLICGAHCILFCYDITSFGMFKSILEHWYPVVARVLIPEIPPGFHIESERQRLAKAINKRHGSHNKGSHGASSFSMMSSLTGQKSKMEDFSTQQIIDTFPIETLKVPRHKQRAHPLMGIVGCKTDISHLRVIPPEIQQGFALEHNIHSFYLSAKSGENFDAVFTQILSELCDVSIKPKSMENAV
ncbi:P-loop containing nucleoside triphosphate hydrolase protein, partial [Rozella allomycis CSF55]